MSRTEKIGVGIVGYGYWGPNLVRNFSESPDANVVGICDGNQQRLAKAKIDYPGVPLYSDFHEMLQNSEVDAISLATPVDTHFPLALKALEAGKHVLVEKPMASNEEQALRLRDAADKRGLTLMVGHTFVYTGAVRKIKELVSSGELGDLHYYDGVRVNLGLFQHDVNVLWDLAIHDLSILDYVLGREPVEVSATGMRHLPDQQESIAYLTLFFEDNLIAHLHVNWMAPVKIRRTLIGGSKKMIVYDDLEPSEKVRVYDRGVDLVESDEDIRQMLVSYRTGDAWIPKIDFREGLAVEVSHFIDCICNSQQPISGASVGVRTVRILEAANRSMQNRGKPIEIKSV